MNTLHVPEARYENPITPSDTVLFSLKQCRGNVINESEYAEAAEHYRKLENSHAELLEALRASVWADENCAYEAPPEFQEAAKLARAALAHATGQEVQS